MFHSQRANVWQSIVIVLYSSADNRLLLSELSVIPEIKWRVANSMHLMSDTTCPHESSGYLCFWPIKNLKVGLPFRYDVQQSVPQISGKPFTFLLQGCDKSQQKRYTGPSLEELEYIDLLSVLLESWCVSLWAHHSAHSPGKDFTGTMCLKFRRALGSSIA